MNSQKKNVTFIDLPNECILEIIEHLDIVDKLSIRQISKDFKKDVEVILRNEIVLNSLIQMMKSGFGVSFHKNHVPIKILIQYYLNSEYSQPLKIPEYKCAKCFRYVSSIASCRNCRNLTFDNQEMKIHFHNFHNAFYGPCIVSLLLLSMYILLRKK